MNDSFLYEILSFQNISKIFSIEKSNIITNKQNYLSNLIHFTLEHISVNEDINIKVKYSLIIIKSKFIML